MQRTIVLAVAGSLLLAGSAFAQVDPAVTLPAPVVTTADPLAGRGNAQGFIEQQAADEYLATDLLGHPVLNPAEENLGAINNLLFNVEGHLTGVIVGVGGFLGIGVKDVAISWDALSLGTIGGETRIVFDADRTALADAPDFQTLVELGIDRVPIDLIPPPVIQLDMPVMPAVEPIPPAPAPEPPAPVEPPPAPLPADPAPAPIPGPTAALIMPLPAEPVPPLPGAAAAVAEIVQGPRGDALGFITNQNAAEILSAELLGRPVFNRLDEQLGAVNNILFGAGGEIEGVVVGVGGFLGIGTKDVAIAFDRIETTVVEGQIRLVFDATRELLDAAPAFQVAD